MSGFWLNVYRFPSGEVWVGKNQWPTREMADRAGHRTWRLLYRLRIIPKGSVA